MKKALVLLLSGLFLYGCGSGGGTTTSSNGSTPGTPQYEVGPAKVFTLNIVDSAKTTAKTVAGTPPTATDVRVVIRRYDTVTITIPEYYNPDTDETIPEQYVTISTEVYRDIQDVAYGGTVQIGIPEGTGYVIDIVTSKLEAGNHSILKYGQATGVAVNSTSTGASVTINTVEDLLAMTVADDVASKAKFTVTLNNVLPFAPAYTMTMNFGSNPLVMASSNTNACTFTAPVSYSAGTVSLQGQFKLDQSLLNAGETAAQWSRIYPNAAYGEEVSSLLSPLWLVTVPL